MRAKATTRTVGAGKPLLLYGGVQHLRLSEGKLVHFDQLSGRIDRYPLEPSQVSQVIVSGALGSISFSALRWLGARGVPLIVIDFSGNLLSVTLPRAPSRPHDRLAQYETALDPERRLRHAESIVRAKVRASYLFLRGIGKETDGLAWSSVGRPGTIADLLALEGRIAERYFRSLGVARSYPNATDRLSAVMNYSYALLASRCRIAWHELGLDPEVGTLHTPRTYREAGVGDAMEPYRWFADLVALETRCRLKARDFLTRVNLCVRLRESGVRALVETFMRRFDDVDRFFGQDLARMARAFSLDGSFVLENESAVSKALGQGPVVTPHVA